MLCPEGTQYQKDSVKKEEETYNKNKVPADGPGTLDLNSFKHHKNWKKSISSFFRGQLRSTKSNDGERPSGSKETFDEKQISPEQKWQSLGKVFRRQSFAEHWNKTAHNEGENSSQNRRLAVRKVISSYFGRTQKNQSVANDK
ncbi:hypothetical protein RR48_08232 [Papilio machaon]|uniref:Uncharacterized protein n=1 Tax=Papilio machaon TaxID=76193 RepID=A0A194RF63_PAPMA|nr:hypothetical protein RR48_08232 [Papilio machaon]